jgi:phage baseplate assembly protein W
VAVQRTYSFKSVGETPQDVRERSAQASRSPPVGIKTPLELGDGDDGLLKMTRRAEDAISDNIRNLILTNKGERLMDYNFGANLKELTFELGSEDVDIEAVTRIREAVGRYMPFVGLETFEPFSDHALDNSVARVGVRITYRIPLINQTERKLEVVLYSVG